MSLFRCNHCATFLSKKKVENHFKTNCQHGVSLTCTDCKAEFDKFTYGKHANCVPKKATAASELSKGDLKQLRWIGLVKGLTKRKGLSQEHLHLLNLMAQHQNVPRTKPKLQNFLQNLPKEEFNEKVVDEVWDMLQENLNKQNETETLLKKNEKEGMKLNAASKNQGKQVHEKKAKQEAKPNPSVNSTGTKKKKQKLKNTNESQLNNDNIGKRKPNGEQQSKKKGKKLKVEEKGVSQ